MMGHIICFYREMWLIIPKLSLLPLLIWSTGVAVFGTWHVFPLLYLAWAWCSLFTEAGQIFKLFFFCCFSFPNYIHSSGTGNHKR